MLSLLEIIMVVKERRALGSYQVWGVKGHWLQGQTDESSNPLAE